MVIDTMMLPGDSEKFKTLFGQDPVYLGPNIYSDYLYSADDNEWGWGQGGQEDDDEETDTEEGGGVQAYKGQPIDSYFTNIEPYKWNRWSTTYDVELSGNIDYKSGLRDAFDVAHISEIGAGFYKKKDSYEDTGHLNAVLPKDGSQWLSVIIKPPRPGEPGADEWRWQIFKVYDHQTGHIIPNGDLKVHIYVPSRGKAYRIKAHIAPDTLPIGFKEKITEGELTGNNLNKGLYSYMSGMIPIPINEEVVVKINVKGNEYKPRYFIINADTRVKMSIPMVKRNHKGDMPPASMKDEEDLHSEADDEFKHYYENKEEEDQRRMERKVCPVCGSDWDPDGWYTKYSKSAKKVYEDMTEQGWYKAAGGKPIKELKGAKKIGFSLGGPVGAVAGAIVEKGWEKGSKDALKKFFKKNSLATCEEFGHLIPMTKEQEEAAKQHQNDKKWNDDKETLMNILKWAGIGFGALLLIGGGIFTVVKFKKKKKKQTVAPPITQAGQVNPQKQNIPPTNGRYGK